MIVAILNGLDVSAFVQGVVLVDYFGDGIVLKINFLFQIIVDCLEMVGSIEFVVVVLVFIVELGFHEHLFFKGLNAAHRSVFDSLLINFVLRNLDIE